jgi:hypothetical protein
MGCFQWAMVLAAGVLLTAAAPEMTAGQFLAGMKKAESLGPAAILSSDARALRAETDRVRQLYIATAVREKRAGGARHSCPPADGKPKMTGDELRSYLNKLSPAARKQPFRVAVFNLMKQKYPCK